MKAERGWKIEVKDVHPAASRRLLQRDKAGSGSRGKGATPALAFQGLRADKYLILQPIELAS